MMKPITPAMPMMMNSTTNMALTASLPRLTHSLFQPVRLIITLSPCEVATLLRLPVSTVLARSSDDASWLCHPWGRWDTPALGTDPPSCPVGALPEPPSLLPVARLVHL